MRKELFEKEFLPEEKELLVLIQHDMNGAVKAGDYLRPSATFLGSVDVTTGEFSGEKGRLEWMFKRSILRPDYGFDLKGMTIYQVRVRKCIEKELAPYMLREMNNRYLLLKVVKKNVHHEALEKIREAYMKPVAVDNEIGHFALNRDYGWFESEIDWLGDKCDVLLETDSDGADTADKAMAALKTLVSDLMEWDEKIRRFAADELVELANDWQDADDIESLTCLYPDLPVGVNMENVKEEDCKVKFHAKGDMIINEKTLALEQRYESTAPYVHSLLRKKQLYSEEKIAEIAAMMEISPQQFKYDLFGNPRVQAKGKEPLTKMKYDLIGW